jgi:hypothetical protein
VKDESPIASREPRSSRWTFRSISEQYLEAGFMWLMVLGIIALCQPWIQVVHAYGVTITLVGLIGFSIFSRIKPLPEDR